MLSGWRAPMPRAPGPDELNGNLPQVHATQGMILRGTGQYEKAAAEFRKAIDLDAANVESQRLLARTLEDLGRSKEAEDVYLARDSHKPSIGLRHAAWAPFTFAKVTMRRRNLG